MEKLKLDEVKGYLISLHPPGPCICPVPNCCWTTKAAGSGATVSVLKHLKKDHGYQNLHRMWQCRGCSVIADGFAFRSHKCNQVQNIRCRGGAAVPRIEIRAEDPEGEAANLEEDEDEESFSEEDGEEATASDEEEAEDEEEDVEEGDEDVGEDFHDAVEDLSTAPFSGYAPIFLTTTTAILQYPGVPSQFCLCNFVTNAVEQAAIAASIIRHLYLAHKLRLTREWKCSTCGVVKAGYEMRKHKCQPAPAVPRASLSPRPNTNRQDILRRLSISTTPSVSIRPSLSVAATQQLTSSASPLLPSASIRSSFLASTQPPAGSQAATGSFVQLWSQKFRYSNTICQLEETLEICSVDWMRNNSSTSSDSGNGRRNNNGTERSTGKRTQARQQQRIRKKRKNNPKAASRIQKLFNQYPRRAVREVLGEDSPSFNGEVEEATIYLKNTYEIPPPTDDGVRRARNTLDSCNWKEPSEEDTDLLAYPPRKEEISRKLLNAANTAPGSDRIEYRHIKKLDPQCALLEVLFEAVWKLGIPNQWKSAKTILIHKKGDTADISNFRPISLLSTIYKLFSSVSSTRLTLVAQNTEWLSVEQKGFLPGVRGIQEHTQLLQTIIDNAKRNKTTFPSPGWTLPMPSAPFNTRSSNNCSLVFRFRPICAPFSTISMPITSPTSS